MERLIGMLARLHHDRATQGQGVPADKLLALMGWADAKDGTSALNRELRYLRTLGWRIDNIAAAGLPAVYRMTAVDNRLKLKLTPQQQTALRRAVLLVDRQDLGDQLDLVGDTRPEELGAAINPGHPRSASNDAQLKAVVTAVRTGARLRFRYNGSDRVVHPESLRTQQTHWYLRGHEDDAAGDGVLKAFVVSRMTDAYADAPGTAVRLPSAQRTRLHPMSWEIDPPVDVTLSAPSAYAADVRRWLGEPLDEKDDGDETVLTYRVTHRAALRARIYQLGTRVRIVGPDEVRDELVAELATMAGE